MCIRDRPSVLSFGLRLLFAVIVFLVGARLIKLLRKFIRRSMERAGADVGLMQFLDSLLKVIFYFVLIMLIASGFGVDTTSVMALVGSAGLTIGLAFQGLSLIHILQKYENGTGGNQYGHQQGVRRGSGSGSEPAGGPLHES